MPSNLRLQPDASSTQSYYPKPAPAYQPQQKQRMSLTQTYRVASTARGKLGREAARSDHNLRLLVGHANLLDTLMVELANAEREQEAWFNDTVRKSHKSESAPKHIQWFDSIVEEDEDELSGSDDDSDADSDVDTEDFPAVAAPPRRRSVSPPPAPSTYDFEDDDMANDDWEDMDEELTLTRVPCHLDLSEPELMHDESESDDESMPPSPGHAPVAYLEKNQEPLSDLFQAVPQKLAAQPTVVATDYMSASPMVTAY